VLPLRSFTVVFPLKKSSRYLAKNTGSVFSDATAILGCVSLPVNGCKARISSFVRIVLGELIVF
jgi:hypothetical protein